MMSIDIIISCRTSHQNDSCLQT